MKKQDNNKFYSAGYLDDDCYEYTRHFKRYKNALKYIEKLKQKQKNDSHIFIVHDKPVSSFFDDESECE